MKKARALLLLAALGSGLAPQQQAGVPRAFDPRSAARPNPLRRDQIIRVGLTTGREKVTISCNGTYRVTDSDGGTVWKESYREPLTVGVRGSPPTEGRIYRVQVGSFDGKNPAEQLAARLRGELGEPVIVVWVPDRKTWRVRAGAASSRDLLANLIGRLRAAGYADAWIADEPVPQAGDSRLVLVDANYEAHEAASKRLLLLADPSPEGSLLSVDGAPYRGGLEVRLDPSGGIRVINVVPVESYLRGVVPAELGPSLYPEIEALKAQTIAARTYVYRNLGQFGEEGFDLCDTPRCQVYAGAKAEHALSDRAIQETEGEIATYLGEPINALYTSTCGGHTEDASEIFPEDAAAYLLGVPCAPEERSRRARRIVLSGDGSLAEAPQEVALAAALLSVHGLLPRGALDAARLEGAIPDAEAAQWIDAMATACGFGEVERNARAGPSIASRARQIVERFGWAERVALLVDREDARSWLPEDASELSDEEAGAVSYFLRQQAWPAGAGGIPDPGRAASRGDLARLLLYAAQDCDLLDLGEGIIRGGGPAGLKVSGKNGSLTRPLATDALLFADFGSGPVPVRRLGMVVGDKVRYHSGPGDRIDQLLLLPGRQGLSDDRYSAVSSWQVAYSAEDLAKRLDEYIGSGKLLEITPVRRGVSGRVTEIKIVGTNGTAVIKGFAIRTALGLRENLFTIDRQKERTGGLRRVVFTGRGWGHGVGMCQVGAYGMALRGLSYREILAHYYSGIALERLP